MWPRAVRVTQEQAGGIDPSATSVFVSRGIRQHPTDSTEADMLTVEEWMDIKDLHRQGHSMRSIAALTGYARNTVRRALRQTKPPPAQKQQRASCVDPFKPYLLSR